MKFIPQTEAEIEKSKQEYQDSINERYAPVEPQHGYFTVVEALDKVSGKGNQMIALTLTVELLDGRKIKIWDYLLEAFPQKLKHFCDITGNEKLYATGGIEASDCIPAEGWCYIGIQKGKGDYKDRNVIEDYVTEEVALGKKTERVKTDAAGKITLDELNDDIPF